MDLIEYSNYRNKVLEHRRDKIIIAKHICYKRDIDVLSIFEHVSENAALNNNPYHNLYHTACMVVNAYDAYGWYIRQNKYHIDPDILISACLLHDVDHTGGKWSDTINIAKALAYTLSLPNDCFVGPSDRHRTMELIAVTEFPFIRTPSTISEQIIRDCDLLQMLEPDWMEMIFVGLLQEIRVKHNISTEDFVEKQIAFLEGAEFYTEWFEQEKRPLFNERLQALKQYAMVLLNGNK